MDKLTHQLIYGGKEKLPLPLDPEVVKMKVLELSRARKNGDGETVLSILNEPPLIAKNGGVSEVVKRSRLELFIRGLLNQW